MVRPGPVPSEPSLNEAASGSMVAAANLAQRELFSLVFAGITDALLVLDEHGNVLLSNEAAGALLGITTESPPLGSWGQIGDVRRADAVTPLSLDDDPIACALRGQELRASEQYLQSARNPNGRFIDVSARPLWDALGRIRGAVLCVRDVTETKRRQQLLEQANEHLRREHEQRSELSALLVHDLKSPLQSIIMNTRFLIGSRAHAEGERDCLRDVLSAADTMHRMVLDLLDLSISEDTELRPDYSEIDVPALLEEVREAMALRALDQRQRIVTSVLLERATMRADRELLRRVLQNLVDNCIKYGPPGGEIGVDARAVEGAIEFRVHDEGPGVPAAQRTRIFDKYARSAASKDGPLSGSRGLGLRFCWLAVQAHAGSIWVEDRLPRGACFCVRIPNR